jgi:hypothetical protein
MFVGDSARVASATVDAISEVDPSGSVIRSWWLVTFDLRDRAYKAEVRIDQRSGVASLRPVHK